MLTVNQLIGFGFGDSINPAFPPKGGNCKFLLHFEGADTSTTFTDSSDSPKTQTANGNAQIDTAQFKFGSASGLFDGTGDYVTSPNSADFNPGSGDFTVDFWVRFSTIANSMRLINFGGTSGSTFGTWDIRLDIISTKLSAEFGDSAGTSKALGLTGTTALSNSTWYHVALTKSGSAIKLYLNGTVEASGTLATLYDATGLLLNIGRQNGTASNMFNGWMDEVRIVNGTADWNGNFTPYTGPYV